MDATQCSINDCSRPVLVKVRGWCSLHYQRWQRTGVADGPNIRNRTFDEKYTITESGCWHWMEIYEGDDGYGKVWVDGVKVAAHRHSYERKYGPIPAGMYIDHLCHDPRTCPGGSTCPHRACVNPSHLAIATHAANCRRGANSKLNYDQAAEIRRRRANGERGVDLAAEFGVRPSTISWIFTGKTWGAH